MSIDSDLRAVEHLLEALGYCSDNHIYENIIELAAKILAPHLETGIPRALWLKARLPNLGEIEPLTDEEMDDKWAELIRLSAFGGCAEAQYRYGCNLYEKKSFEEALGFYEMSAIQGYAPAQWCFGIDTLYGVGVSKDEEKGLKYIRQAAEQHYEFAINFLIDNIKDGNYGLTNDTEEIKKLEENLERHGWSN